MNHAELEQAKLTIGTRLREARKAKGITQAELAESTGTIPAAIEKLENSEVLSPYMIVEMATVLGVTPAWLLWGNPFAPMQIDYCQVGGTAEKIGITRRS